MDYTTQHTWAELDKANGNHYGRGKPAAMLHAEKAKRNASTMYDQISDLFERGAADGEEVAEALDTYLLVIGYHDRVYAKWMANNLVIDHYNRLRNDIADYMELREMSQT